MTQNSLQDITAGFLITGNEILSGQISDENLQYLAKELEVAGIRLVETRIVNDSSHLIASSINELRHKYDYIFTSGGIGGTHDDITISSIAEALDIGLILCEKTDTQLAAYYGDRYNDMHRKMAYFPEGYELIDNAVSNAPGCKIENIYILAGVPRIFRAMLSVILPQLETGIPYITKSFSVLTSEGEMAKTLEEIQIKYQKSVSIGSYPFLHRENNDIISASLIVFRSTESDLLEEAARKFEKYVQNEKWNYFTTK